jgi:hypothetical protein
MSAIVYFQECQISRPYYDRLFDSTGCVTPIPEVRNGWSVANEDNVACASVQ